MTSENNASLKGMHLHMHAQRYQQCVKGLFGQLCSMHISLFCVKSSTPDQEGVLIIAYLPYANPKLGRRAGLPPSLSTQSTRRLRSNAVIFGRRSHSFSSPPLTQLCKRAIPSSYVGIFSSNQYSLPTQQGFSFPPPISLGLIADRTLPFSERGTRPCAKFPRLMLQWYLPSCGTNACTLNPFLRFFNPTLEGISRPIFSNFFISNHI